MKRNWAILSIFMLVVTMCAVVPAVLAAEHPGQSMGEKAAMPTSSVSTSTPQIASAEGSVSDVDFQANTLKLTASDGKFWTLTLDPKSTLVWKGGQILNLTDIKAGEQVKVRYTSKEGKQVAKSVDIAQTAAMSTTSATSSTIPTEVGK